MDVLLEGPLLPYTLSLVLGAVPWVLTLLGVLHLDIHGEMDLQGEVDVDTHIGSLGALEGVLLFLGVSTIPLGVLFSILFFLFGITGLGLHALLGGPLDWSPWTLNVLFIPLSLAAAIGGAALLSRALGPLFADYGRAPTPQNLIGKTATIHSGTISTRFGSAIVDVEGARMEIAARAEHDDNEMAHGQRVLVIYYDSANGTYLVEPLEDEQLGLLHP